MQSPPKFTAKKFDKELSVLSSNAIAKTTSTVIGLTTGFLLEGAAGSLVGGAIGSVGEDLVKRFLSPKELSRIEKAQGLSIKGLNKNLQEGLHFREDLSREEYEQIYEGVLLKAREAYEEKKVPLFANLFAKTPFVSIPLEDLNQTLLFVEQLSYRHLCILSVVQFTDVVNRPLSKIEYREIKKLKNNSETIGLFQDVHYLIRQGFIALKNEVQNTLTDITLEDIIPMRLILTYQGNMLYELLNLSQVVKEDRNKIIQILS